ncbi:hypothetical protein T492DRAFT_964332 [Pavlovales sp. CCMP2436]|nr:hypothetical protein T492DRAFT_964332 [Pavlovales sp. CCMP2436]
MLASPERCPLPTLEGRGDICESIFAVQDKPCIRGQHSALCLDFPERSLSESEYEAACAAAHSPWVRVQLIDNEIFVVNMKHNKLASKYPRILLRHLRHIASAARIIKLPDVDFLISVADGSPSWPVFAHNNPSWRRDKTRTYHVPTDTGVSKTTPPPTGDVCGSSASRAERARWAQKDQRLQFRGSATGSPVNRTGWSRNSRARLAVLSTLFPDWVDAKLTQLWTEPAETELLSHFIKLGKGMAMAESKTYKYVIYLDGHSQSNRLAALMHAGPIVLFTSNHDVQYSASLHRIPHVINVKSDLSDLMTVLGCLRAHDDVALERQRLGVEAARELITYANGVTLYWADLIEHYSRLQQFKVTRHPLAVTSAKYRYLINGKWVALDREEIKELEYPYIDVAAFKRNRTAEAAATNDDASE